KRCGVHAIEVLEPDAINAAKSVPLIVEREKKPMPAKGIASLCKDRSKALRTEGRNAVDKRDSRSGNRGRNRQVTYLCRKRCRKRGQGASLSCTRTDCSSDFAGQVRVVDRIVSRARRGRHRLRAHNRTQKPDNQKPQNHASISL